MRFPRALWIVSCLCACLHAQTKANFSGRWTLNPEKSKLQIPKPTSTRFAIEHREPAFRLTRTHVYGEKSDTLTLELKADGMERAHDAGGSSALIRLYWEGSSLVAEMKVARDGEQALNLVRYSLADEGRTFVGVERFRSAKVNYDNLWVFDRETKLDEALRRELVGMRAADLHPREAGDPETHRKQAARLRELVARHGWPGEDIAGPDGAEAAWMIAQHSGDAELQGRLRQAAAEGRVPEWQAVRRQEALVTGIGGFFFRATDPAAMRKWYDAQFGIRVPTSYGDSVWVQDAGPTAFSPFGKTSTYFGRPEQMWMLNFRVADLTATVERLRKAGIEVEVDPKEYPNGWFARLKDPEGNPIQLWQWKPPVQ